MISSTPTNEQRAIAKMRQYQRTCAALEARVAELESELSEWQYLAIERMGWDGPCPGDDDYERGD